MQFDASYDANMAMTNKEATNTMLENTDLFRLNRILSDPSVCWRAGA